jgi:hypothetical protein
VLTVNPPETPSTPNPEVGSFVGAKVKSSWFALCDATPDSPRHWLVLEAIGTSVGAAVMVRVVPFLSVPATTVELDAIAIETPEMNRPVLTLTLTVWLRSSEVAVVAPAAVTEFLAALDASIFTGRTLMLKKFVNWFAALASINRPS